MSKDANSFGHDKALAWESRGFVYTKRGCIVSTHPPLVMLEVYKLLLDTVVAAHELIYASGCIYQFRFTSVERVRA